MTTAPAVSAPPHAPPARARRLLVLVPVLLVALCALAVFALCLGTPNLSPGQVWDILTSDRGARIARLVVLELRLPRLLLGVLTGAGLALAGVLLQDATRNPLAGPELLGVSVGASVVIAVIVIFRLPLPFLLYPPLALVGGLASGLFVILLTRRTKDTVRLILVGAAVTALLNALLISVISLGEQQDIQVLYQFLLGSLAGRTWDYVRLVAPWVVVGVPLAMVAARPLNLLQLGDELAEGLGLPVLRARLLIVLLAAAMVAATVAVCGPIGYVALLAPHLTRRLLGTQDARQVLPVAGLVGAVLLCAADLLARQLFAPLELPVGIWTTIIGGPVLLVLLRRQLRGRGRS